MRILVPLLVSLSAAYAGTVSSPDGRIAVDVQLKEDGSPSYRVSLGDTVLLRDSRLGLVRDDADFTANLKPAGESPVTPVEDRYEILTAKRRENTYRANRREFGFTTPNGERLEIIFQVSNDGVAFRYRFPEKSEKTHSLREEVTSFHLPEGAVGWLQPMEVAKEGWSRTFPSYEEFYEMEIPVGTPSKLGAGWVFPALFKTGENWIVVSETGTDRNYAGCRLRHESPDGEYTIGFPDPRETIHGLPANPSSTLPWETPWRVIAIGSLKTVAESMLGVDLARPAVKFPGLKPRPGRASWSWVLLKDDHTIFKTQKEFIDYAAEMGWEYCLVDALWDVQIGEEKLAELSAYAQSKGVGILLWYNSNGNWNDAPQTPKDRLLTPESRAKEFAWLNSIGVKGLKVDFFGGDGQPVINQYIDLMEEAGRHGILMNFHGTTIPRGWHRTYPNLMTMEAIKGLEFVTFDQRNADAEPTHATVIPFTRNVFDPMDFTPVAMEPIPNIERRTSLAFELALSVLFTSGIQHFGQTPAGMAAVPDYVRQFMRDVPAAWDDVRFIDGYPGKFAVIARLSGDRWYVAGVNGTEEPVNLSLDLSFLPSGASYNLITDGDDAGFSRSLAKVPAGGSVPVALQPRGGFTLVSGD